MQLIQSSSFSASVRAPFVRPSMRSVDDDVHRHCGSAAAAHDGARRMQTTKAPLAPVDRLVVAEPVETTDLGSVWIGMEIFMWLK